MNLTKSKCDYFQTINNVSVLSPHYETLSINQELPTNVIVHDSDCKHGVRSSHVTIN